MNRRAALLALLVLVIATGVVPGVAETSDPPSGSCSGIGPILRDGDAPGAVNFGCAFPITADGGLITLDLMAGSGFTGAVRMQLFGGSGGFVYTRRCSWIAGMRRGCVGSYDGHLDTGGNYICSVDGDQAAEPPFGLFDPIGQYRFVCGLTSQ